MTLNVIIYNQELNDKKESELKRLKDDFEASVVEHENIIANLKKKLAEENELKDGLENAHSAEIQR